MVGVTSSGAAETLHIRRGFLFAQSKDTKREIRMQSPNTNSATSTGRIILKPCCAHFNSSCCQKAVTSSVRVDTCGPVAMSARIMFKVLAEPTSAGQSISAHHFSSGDAG